MKLLHFLPLFFLVACSAQDAGAIAVSANSSAAANGDWEKADGDAATSSKLTEAGLPAYGEQEPRGNKIEAPVYTPAKEAEYHFETDAISDAELKDFYLEMDISLEGKAIGTMTFVLWGDEAPITVRNFLRYADEGFYSNKVFHRVLRDFMIQGGSSNNTGSGQGPHPKIRAEFSREKQRRHRYGVLSMARGGGQPDSASSQFFVITDSHSPSTKGLDGQYASFGIMIHGVSTLEQIADIPVTSNGREQSKPTQNAIITECRVKRGEPTVAQEKIERPPLDLHGEPERVRIQHVLISFAGTRTTATRTKEEAEKLAQEVLARAKAGEDFGALVKEFTDDPSGKTTTPPGTYSMLNRGQYPPDEETAKQMELQTKIQKLQEGLLAKVNAKELTMDEAKAQFFAIPEVMEFQALQAKAWLNRGDMVPAFGNVGFSLEIGEVGMSQYDVKDSPFGWHIILRYE